MKKNKEKQLEKIELRSKSIMELYKSVQDAISTTVMMQSLMIDDGNFEQPLFDIRNSLSDALDDITVLCIMSTDKIVKGEL